jgi:hypothetical protein
MTEGRRVTHADVPATIYPLGVAYLSDPPLWSSVGKIIDGIPGDWHRSRPSSPQAPLRHGHPWTRDPAGALSRGDPLPAEAGGQRDVRSVRASRRVGEIDAGQRAWLGRSTAQGATASSSVVRGLLSAECA